MATEQEYTNFKSLLEYFVAHLEYVENKGNISHCGYIQWYNPAKQSQYFVFLFKTNTFSGELKDSPEGKVKWMMLDEMLAGKLAPNMTKYLSVFQNENIPQAYGISNHVLNLVDNKGILSDI